ncbi:helix-turn-helix domain-containing protein [Flavobacterium sp. CSZ]|uniref:AraC family transcriptional regulator n=1 Tax=Flavobacterium sp. CSZ TaxID=2783791 RepID=UPI00188CCDD6|nr:helix-turn-helix domain-containing protein [Flavobacterium sp. CSZ]MBF4485801.1 AraC family transcriptional regulator [Flavobacterium sp. CSZ]
MIKNLINSKLQMFPIEGFDIHIIKKYEELSGKDESFKAQNLAVLLIKSGNFKLKIEDVIQELSVRDLIIIPKDSDCHVIEVLGKLHLYLIIFSSDFAVKNCLRKELVDSFYFFIRKEPMKASLDENEYSVLSLIYRLIYYINLDSKKDGHENELHRISLNLFIYELKLIYNKYASNSIPNFTRKENIVMQFLTILSIHYKKHHHVQFYAGALFITPIYLNRVVKEVTGKSVKLLIIEAIISEAKILLEDGQISLAEIAEEMEFASTSIFGIFFKKHTSLSPSDYRTSFFEKSRGH